MKSDRLIQTRRKAPKSTFTMLYAATRSTKRRKQRAATTANPEELGEVPGVGIARALVVILLIHVAAIAGIYLHNRGNEGSDLKAAPPALEKDKAPTLLDGHERGIPNVGDNYAKMAQRYGVDEQELRRLNENKPIKAGWKYNLPHRRIENITPADAVAGQINPPEDVELPTPVSRPPIQTSDRDTHPGSVPGDLVAVGDDLPPLPEATAEPILIRPRLPQPEAPATTTKTHKVKSGETLWGISRANGVSVDDLMTLNGIKNASALKIGAVLKIPAKR